MTRPVLSTYRLQLGPELRFADVSGLVPYFAKLGVSHLYLSPVLQATSGSDHGYDVVDHGRISRELGGADELAALVDASHDAGLGLVVDIVANHMDIGHPLRGSWWWDVLAHGPASRFATYFDIDWRADRSGGARLLLPVLDDHYGRVLRAGRLTLQRDGGEFVVLIDRDEDSAYPLSPSSMGLVLHAVFGETSCGVGGFIADGLARLATLRGPGANQRHSSRDALVLETLLAELVGEDPVSRDAIDAGLAAFSADAAALHALLERQSYRLAHWRTGNSELRYRRFFDVTSLIGLRMEEHRVFADTHRTMGELVHSGAIDGLRVDHPDGLANPARYFDELARACPDGTWVVAEKVLGPDETLRERWQVAGTTGYDFLWRTTALFVDPAGETAMSQLYRSYTGDTYDFADHVTVSRRLVAETLLQAELDRATELLRRECDAALEFRDFTNGDLRSALAELLAAMTVYRTYVVPDGSGVGGEIAPQDLSIMRDVVDRAVMRMEVEGHSELLELLGDLLTLTAPSATSGELACRFQQLSGAVAAKGVEDTAMYRYGRLLALNEVGGDPSRFGLPVEEYHRYLGHISQDWPATMTAGSTHDTKRSEDVRARIGVLSEVAAEWAERVARWTDMVLEDGCSFDPGAATRYFFFQTLVGTFPIDPDRLAAYLCKSAREAKLETSWLRPDPSYEAGLHRFVCAALANPTFVASVEAFVRRCSPAARAVSLGQTALRLAAPGVVDIYQGSELWTGSLVDPDNRGPVDFELRCRELARLDSAADEVEQGMSEDSLGRAKLALLHAGLRLRRERPGTFLRGGYRPLRADGINAQHAVAFLRGDDVAVVATRFLLRLVRDGGWGDTTVELPSGGWRDQVSGRTITVGRVGRAMVSEVLGAEPVALLARQVSRGSDAC